MLNRNTMVASIEAHLKDVIAEESKRKFDDDRDKVLYLAGMVRAIDVVKCHYNQSTMWEGK